MLASLRLRPTELNDIEGIREVAIETWNSTYELIYPEHYIANFLNHAYSKSSLEESITHDQTRPSRKFLVAEVNEEIIGFGQLSDPVDGRSELTRLYVLKEYQRMGIGKALLNELIHLDPSIKEIFALVERDNGIGTLFYQSNGFVFVEENEEVIFDHHTILAKYVKQIS